MEIIFIFAKFVEHVVVAPLWWVATYFAATIYPLEDDWRQETLGVVFSILIVAGLYFGYSFAFPSPPEAAAVTEAAPAIPNNPSVDIDELKAQMETLKAIKSMNASIPAPAAP
jgi:hypothetical protein